MTDLVIDESEIVKLDIFHHDKIVRARLFVHYESPV